MKRSAQDTSDWSTRPLCRRYVLGIFDTTTVRLGADDHAADRPVHWAFGCLPDGESELLGVWTDPPLGEDASRQIVADLQWRGVERIWHVAGGAIASMQEHIVGALSSVSVFSSGERSRPAASIAARQPLPSPAELAAERARNELIRSVRRRGSFANESAALDFIAGALQRTERRLDRESAIAKGRPRPRSGAQTVPPGF